jgi:tetratricopeptide (TPR) repeat protein
MKSLSKVVSAVCLVQIGLLSLTGLPAYCLTADGTAQAASGTAELDTFEQSLYGYAKTKQPVDDRLNALEMTIFGAKQNGTTGSRIAAISLAVGKSKTDLLLPPLAPKLDTHSEPVATTSSRSSSDQYNSSRDDSSRDQATADAETPAERSKEALQHATLLYSQGHMAEAEQAFKHVLTLDYRNADAYYNLGVIAESRGDLQGALGHYQRAANLKPADSELGDAVRAVQSKIGDRVAADSRAKAQQQQAQDLARASESKENLKRTAADAQVAFKSGDYNRAIAGLTTVANSAPNDPDVQYALAQAYRGKGDLNSARQALGRALSLDPQNQLYRTALSDLKNASPSGSNNNVAYGNQAASPPRQSGYSSPGGYTSPSPYTSPSDSGNGNSAYGQAGSGAAPAPFSGDSSASGVTPFTASGESQLQSTPGYHHGYANGGSPSFSMTSFGGLPLGLGLGGLGMGMGMGGMGMGNNTRLKRVAIGAGTGMAVGALMGMPSHHAGKSAMKGALVGGMLGLITGGF